MIPFLDLYQINKRFKSDFEAVLSSVLKNGQYILGPYVQRFETSFAQYCGSKYCIGVGNGLEALTLILKAYIYLGILKKGDKVIVPSHTFIASILAVIHAELQPVFVEPDLETFNISTEGVKAHLSKDVKAIIMVHLYGCLAKVDTLKDIAKAHNLLLIADAAQAHGAHINSKKAGSFAEAAAFSFYPTKNLGALGDGGAITTNNEDLFETLKLLRNYGSKIKYTNEVVGYNSRLDALQAAFLEIKLKYLDADNTYRRMVAESYLKNIVNPHINLPCYNGGTQHVFYAFVVRVKNRTHFTNYLTKNKIGWHLHYPHPTHKQKALAPYNKINLPLTEKLAKEVVSLPISPVISKSEIVQVIEVLNNYNI